jgi:hypothetical protein
MNPQIVRIPVEKVEKLIASIDRLSELIQKMDDHRRENETVDMVMDGIISELQADVARRSAEPVSAREFESKRHAELQEAVTRIEQNRRKQDRKQQDQYNYQVFGGLWE